MGNSFSSVLTGQLRKDKERQSQARDRIANRSAHEAAEARRDLSKVRTQSKGKQSWTKRQHEEAVRQAKIDILRDTRFAVSGAIKSIADPRSYESALAAITKMINEIENGDAS